MQFENYAQVYIEGIPFQLTYGIPSDLKLKAGMLVNVPIQNKQQQALVIGVSQKCPIAPDKIKPLLAIANKSKNHDVLFTLCELLGRYYTTPWYFIFWQFSTHWPAAPENKMDFYSLSDKPIQALSPVQKKLKAHIETFGICSAYSLLQAGFKQKTIEVLINKNLILTSQKNTTDNPPQLVSLNQEQRDFVDRFKLETFHAHLLWGVTGSGKTECFSHLITMLGGQALVLVPEIGLVQQTVQKLEMRLGQEVLAYHSNLSNHEREQVRSSLQHGQHQVVVATRSGIFLSFAQLSLIIIDEEHDPAYQQDTAWPYHARDIAIWRAKVINVPILMASATPSLATLHNTKTGKFALSSLTKKALNQNTVQMHVTDLNKQKVTKGFASSTLKAINDTLSQNKHVIVFLNRRGYAPRLSCDDCAHVPYCNGCSSALVYHANKQALICHHCGTRCEVPQNCPECKSQKLVPMGYGTQQISEFLQEKFTHEVLCIDQDHVNHELLTEHVNHLISAKPSIVVGTQMISKGHDFKRIGLVVLHQVDHSLQAYDPFSPEKFLQLFFQVQGRAARHPDEKAHIIIQTRRPDNQWIQKLHAGEIKQLYDHLLADRAQAKLPPYAFQAKITSESKHSSKARDYLHLWQKTVQFQTSQWLGPAPCILEKRAGFYRFQCHVTAPSRSELIKCIALLKKNAPKKNHHTLRTQIEMDPMSS